LDVASASGVLANDSDVDGDVLTATVVVSPQHGTLILDDDGAFRYTPDADFNGSDSFTYTVSDGTAVSSESTVKIVVNSVADAPEATDDSCTVDEDVVLTVAAAGVLNNDTDADGDSLSAILVSDVSHGSLTLNLDGSFSYDPDDDFSGTDTFTYRANDSQTSSTTATVTINVTAVNDAPVAVADEYGVVTDGTLTADAQSGTLSNDSDVEGDLLTVSLATDASHGTLSLASDGSFSYSPDSGFSGTDNFEYSVSDGQDSNTATATIYVSADPLMQFRVASSSLNAASFPPGEQQSSRPACAPQLFVVWDSLPESANPPVPSRNALVSRLKIFRLAARNS